MAKKDNNPNINEVKVEQTLMNIIIQLLQDIKQLLEEKKTKEQNENRWRI